MKQSILLLLFFSAMLAGAQTPAIGQEIEGLLNLDSAALKSRVFLSGENHKYRDLNGKLELALLKYLHREAGVRNLLIELGFSRGYLINGMINGDSSMEKLLKGVSAPAYMEQYRALRSYNLSLPAAERIRVNGVDVERFSSDAPLLLNKLLQGRTAMPEELAFSIEVIASFAKYNTVRYGSLLNNDEDGREYPYYGNQFSDGRVIDSLLTDYERNRSLFMQYTGADSALFDRVMHSLKEYRLYESYRNMPQQYIFRERRLFSNLHTLLLADSSSRYFGQFGRCHISFAELNEECSWWAFHSLARRLKQHGYSVVNFAIFYQDKPDQFFRDDFFKKDTLRRQLAIYLHRNRHQQNTLLRIQDGDSALRAYFQYALVAKGAMLRLREKKDHHSNTGMMNLSFGGANYGLDNLNDALSGAQPLLNRQITSFAFGFSSAVRQQFMDIDARFLFAQSARLDGRKYTLGGYTLTQSFGFVPHISRHFTLIPYFTYGLSKFSFDIEYDSIQQNMSPGFSVPARSRYVNPAFVMGGGLDVRLSLSPGLGIFFRAQWLGDLSSAYWRAKEGAKSSLDRNTPRTSLQNLLLAGGISFLFQEI